MLGAKRRGGDKKGQGKDNNNNKKDGTTAAGTPLKGVQKPGASTNTGKGKGSTHTIVLMQTAKHDSTRFYLDFPGLTEAIDGEWVER